MRAVLFDGSSVALRGDVELAPPRAGEIEVAVAAAGVCHSDLHVLRGEWQVPVPW